MNNSLAQPLKVLSWDVEYWYDYLKINNRDFSGSYQPDGLIPNGSIYWVSDEDITGKGWKICGNNSQPEIDTCQLSNLVKNSLCVGSMYGFSWTILNKIKIKKPWVWSWSALNPASLFQHMFIDLLRILPFFLHLHQPPVAALLPVTHRVPQRLFRWIARWLSAPQWRWTAQRPALPPVPLVPPLPLVLQLWLWKVRPQSPGQEMSRCCFSPTVLICFDGLKKRLVND